ncbi:hypothetical protein [Photobacterium damselae]|uniref:hypothetical protein n=1 Tax=Photobacterium damselae TaxID=38293 RepID=UPI0040682F66
MAKKTSKRNTLKKTIFKANISKLEKSGVLLLLLLTSLSILLCIYKGEVSYSSSVFEITKCAKKLIGINIIALIAVAGSYAIADKKAHYKGILLTVALCEINLVEHKTSVGVFDRIGGIFTMKNGSTDLINQCTQISQVISSVILIVLIALVFCRKAR